MNTTVLIRSYTEEGYKPIPIVRPSDEEYARGLQCFVPTCTDIVPINRKRKEIYLSRRKAKPMQGWWWLGGKMNAAETKEESALRCLKRETGLEIASDRLHLVAMLDFRWKDRAQEPQTIGCHMSSCVFAVEFTNEELRLISANLEEQEYELDSGLVVFSRERLVSEKVFSSVLDVYDTIFPLKEDVQSGMLEVVSSDERREILEYSFSEGAFQDFRIKGTTKPLGQHFHRSKFEIFYFLEGGGTVKTASVDHDGNIVGDVLVFDARPGMVIKIPPGHAHRFDVRPGTRFLAFSSKAFDANDLIPCPIA